MAKSLFLAAARAMDDFALKQRIQAAALFHAQSLIVGDNGPPKFYALHAVLNPQELDPTMLALIAVDEDIAEHVVVAEDGGAVDTSAVPDATILAKVQAKWVLVSEKYQTNPLA